MKAKEKKKKTTIRAKHLDGLRCYGEWEMKRGILRTWARDGNDIKGFMISMDTILEALVQADVTFVAEKKRVHEHLTIKPKEKLV